MIAQGRSANKLTSQFSNTAEDTSDKTLVVARGLGLLGQLGLAIVVTARQ